MAKVTVQVKPEHYVRAECHSVTTCVLALAIQEATGNKGWNVSGDAVMHKKKDVWHILPPELDDLANFADFYLNGMDVRMKNYLAGGLLFPLYKFRLDTATGEVDNIVRTGNAEELDIATERVGGVICVRSMLSLVDGEEERLIQEEAAACEAMGVEYEDEDDEEEEETVFTP